MLYPFIIKHARRLFPADDSAAVFVAKLFGVWIVAVVPFAIVALLSPNSPVAESSTMQDWYTQSGVRFHHRPRPCISPSSALTASDSITLDLDVWFSKRRHAKSLPLFFA